MVRSVNSVGVRTSGAGPAGTKALLSPPLLLPMLPPLSLVEPPPLPLPLPSLAPPLPVKENSAELLLMLAPRAAAAAAVAATAAPKRVNISFHVHVFFSLLHANAKHPSKLTAPTPLSRQRQ